MFLFVFSGSNWCTICQHHNQSHVMLKNIQHGSCILNCATGAAQLRTCSVEVCQCLGSHIFTTPLKFHKLGWLNVLLNIPAKSDKPSCPQLCGTRQVSPNRIFNPTNCIHDVLLIYEKQKPFFRPKDEKKGFQIGFSISS